MKVAVIGSGGREHAICLSLKNSKKIDKIYSIPGNAGISKIAENVEIKINNFEKIKKFILDKKIDLVIVGPEIPLVEGIVDYLEKFIDNNINKKDSLKFLIYNTLPGTTSAAGEKSKFLKNIILGKTIVKEISKTFALELLSHMKGGPSIEVLLDLDIPDAPPVITALIFSSNCIIFSSIIKFLLNLFCFLFLL